MEDLNAIKVIDTATHKVSETWPIAPGEAATGMAFDAANHRLFIGCDNKLMLMVDSTNGKMIYSVPVGAGVDSTWFDPVSKLAFTLDGESGTVTIAREESPTLLKRSVPDLENAAGCAHDGPRPDDAYHLSRRDRLRTSTRRIENAPEAGRRDVPGARLHDEMSRSMHGLPPFARRRLIAFPAASSESASKARQRNTR